MRGKTSGSRSAPGERGPDEATRGDTAGRNDRGGGRERRPRADRGQTTFDFTVGVSIFLLVVVSIFVFVPGTLEPFSEGGQEDIVTTNRVADSLSEGLLGDPGQPHVLNTTCTVEFFRGNSPGYCRYDGNNLTERIGVENRAFVNVSLRSNTTGSDGTDVLCWDEDDGPTPRFVERDDGTCDGGEVVTAVGPTPPRGSGTAVTARRIVQINGTDATLLVEVW